MRCVSCAPQEDAPRHGECVSWTRKRKKSEGLASGKALKKCGMSGGRASM